MPKSPQIARWLILAGVLLPLVDLALIAAFAAQHPDYSHFRHLISQLGESGRPSAAWVNGWFALSSALLSGFAVSLGMYLPQNRWSTAAVICFLVWSVLGIVAGLFPCDPGCEGKTLSGAIHLWAGAVGMAAMLPVPGFVWCSTRRDPIWHNHAWFAFPLAGVFLVVTALVVAANVEVSIGRQELRELAGLLQRLLWVAYYVWIAGVGATVLRTMNATTGSLR